jgi:hypothetical protein
MVCLVQDAESISKVVFDLPLGLHPDFVLGGHLTLLVLSWLSFIFFYFFNSIVVILAWSFLLDSVALHIGVYPHKQMF